MAANDALIGLGTYGSLETITTLAQAGVSGGTGPVSGALTNDNYPLLDFKLKTTLTTAFVATDQVHLYRQPSDGTDVSPDNTSSIKGQYVGSFTIINATSNGTYYLYGVANVDPNDEFWVENDGASASVSLSGTLYVRGRTLTPATA